MKKYIEEIERIATQYSCSQADGYAQIMRICDAMKESLDGEEVCCTKEVTDFDKLLGRTPDYERYPGCGYDRSWCG